MSNYRDDEIATAVAGDETWINWGSLAEEMGRATAVAFVGIGFVATATATASVEASTHTAFMPQALATASDSTSGQVAAIGLALDAAKAGDASLKATVGYTATATATASAEAITSSAYMVAATATASDSVTVQRGASVMVLETAGGHDAPVFHAALVVTATATASAEPIIRAGIHIMAEDVAAASAEAFVETQVPAMATATASAGDEVTAHLHAINWASDTAAAFDLPVFADGIHGQAWTANTSNWAMSRYAPYGFDHIAVVNGQLLGCNQDGVYRLQGGDETINASIQTGKLDIGGGMLAHPLGAFTEYELVDGAAAMDVTTTQAGTASTYTYLLPAEPADELTNGRFIFGRGLRGRHFSFTLRLDAKRAHINDLSVNTAQTQRRI